MAEGLPTQDGCKCRRSRSQFANDEVSAVASSGGAYFPVFRGGATFKVLYRCPKLRRVKNRFEFDKILQDCTIPMAKTIIAFRIPFAQQNTLLKHWWR